MMKNIPTGLFHIVSNIWQFMEIEEGQLMEDITTNKKLIPKWRQKGWEWEQDIRINKDPQGNSQLSGFTSEELIFFCPTCRCSLHPDHNKPVILSCCKKNACKECIGGQIEDQNRNCQYCHSPRTAAYNFAVSDSLTALLKDQRVNEKSICKQSLIIGMLPQKMIVQFMENFFLKNQPINILPFYSSNGTKNVLGCVLKEIEDSYLNEKQLTINFRNPIQFTQQVYSKIIKS